MSDRQIAPFENARHRTEVVRLWQEVFDYPQAHNEPSLVIDQKLAVEDGLFFVATAEGAVVGTIMAGYDGHRGWLYSLAVLPGHRAQGFGRALMSHAEAALARRGCVKINLQILPSNAAVVRFYESLGYAAEERLSMGKRLPESIP